MLEPLVFKSLNMFKLVVYCYYLDAVTVALRSGREIIAPKTCLYSNSFCIGSE